MAIGMTLFDPIPRRDASPTIRGFVYQTNLTIQRWLALRENESLELECGEDIDIVARGIVTGDERTLEQVRDRITPVTLRSALESVANFALHRERNPNLSLRFRFSTTAPVGREQGTTFPLHDPGIVVWQRLRNGEAPDAEQTEISNALRAFHRDLQQPNEIAAEAWAALRRVVEEASDEQWRAFLTSFEWSIGNDSLPVVDAAIRSDLIRLGSARDDGAAVAQHGTLFVYVIRLLSTAGEKRLSFADVARVLAAPRDTELETRVASLFERVSRVEARVDTMETRFEVVELQVQSSALQIESLNDRSRHTERDLRQIAKAVEDLTARGIDAQPVVAERRTIVIENIPPTPARVTRRPDAVAALRTEVSARTWTAVLGEPETGKTQLAVLLSQEWPDKQWFSSAHFSSIEALELRMRSIIGIAEGNHDLSVALVTAVPRGSLFVFDDLPRLDNRDTRAAWLGSLASAARDHIHILSLSTSQAPRLVWDVLGDQFASITIPPFTDEEASELFQLYGAPPEFPDRTIEFLNALARGNPTLLTAVARYLASRAWQIDTQEVHRLLSGAHLEETGRELLLRLRNDVQDARTRELFSRTRLARRGLALEGIRHLGEVDPAIDRIAERLLDLHGLWLRRDDANRYAPTPLATALPPGDLQLTTERHCHIVLAEEIIELGRMDREALMDVMYHFMQAQEFDRAGGLFASALARIVHDEAWHETLVPAMYTAAQLPAEMALHLRLYIRTQQLKIARNQRGYPKHLLEDGLRLVHEASPADAAMVASFATEVAFEDSGDHEIWSAAMDAVSKLTELQPATDELSFRGQPLPDQTWGMLFYMVGRSVRTVEDVDRWTEAADRLSEERRREVLATAFDRQSLINAAWLRVAKTADPSWADILAVHRRWREWAERIGDDLLAVYAIRAEVIVRAEYMNESDEALAFANEMLSRFGGTHERFILNETIATQLRRLRRYEEAARSYDAAFDDFDAATHTEQVYALHHAASVVARHDLARAAGLLERARDIVRDSVNEFDPARLAIVSADLGLAYWYGGRLTEAFNEWDSVASMLIDDGSLEEKARRGLIALLMMVLQQVSNILENRELGENERAVVGTFDRDVLALAEHWKPAQIALLAAALTLIAERVGRDDRAFSWIDRAVAVARELNDPVVTTFVALQAFPWALARHDFANAVRFALELRGPRERAPKPGDSELAQYVFLIVFQLCALMLTNPQDARDAMTSVSTALREVDGEPDAPVLADLLAAVGRNEDREAIDENCERTPPGTAVGAIARLLRASSSGRSTIERATDHLTIAPHVASRQSLWRDMYARIALSFFEAFWQHEVSVNAFRFRAPANFRRELEQIHNLPPAQRLQGLLEAVADAIDLPLSTEFRAWFRQSRT